jgi:hypothetical protein
MNYVGHVARIGRSDMNFESQSMNGHQRGLQGGFSLRTVERITSSVILQGFDVLTWIRVMWSRSGLRGGLFRTRNGDEHSGQRNSFAQ